MRSQKRAAEDDRRTSWKLALGFFPNPPVNEEQLEQVEKWLEDGQPSLPFLPAHQLAVRIAAELEAERKRVTFEVASVFSRKADPKKGDHVRVEDPHSRHYGKSGLVWFVRDGRVMVSMADPRSIGGSVSDSFLPEHLQILEDPAPVNLERAVLLRFMRENAAMCENLTSTQERCTVLLEATRALRQKIVELGGEDPGPA